MSGTGLSSSLLFSPPTGLGSSLSLPSSRILRLSRSAFFFLLPSFASCSILPPLLCGIWPLSPSLVDPVVPSLVPSAYSLPPLSTPSPSTRPPLTLSGQMHSRLLPARVPRGSSLLGCPCSALMRIQRQIHSFELFSRGHEISMLRFIRAHSSVWLFVALKLAAAAACAA